MFNTLCQLKKGGEFFFFNSVNDVSFVSVVVIMWLISMPLWIFITIWKLINGEELWSPSIWSWYEMLQKSVQKAFITCKRCWNRRANSISPTRQPSANSISSTRQPSASGISPIVLQQILGDKEDEINKILQDKEVEINRILQNKEDEINRIQRDKEDEINRIRTEAANNTSTASCTICLQEFSNDRYKVAFNPCGHCCCHECAPQIQPCHECRRHIQNKVRLFE